MKQITCNRIGWLRVIDGIISKSAAHKSLYWHDLTHCRVCMVQKIYVPESATFIFCCDQAALRTLLSVRLSVRLSVTPVSLCSHPHIILKFSGVITNDKGDVHAGGQGQRSKVKVTEIKTLLSRFRTLTPVWIHIWRWNDTKSLMWLRRGDLLSLKVIRQISRSRS